MIFYIIWTSFIFKWNITSFTGHRHASAQAFEWVMTCQLVSMLCPKCMAFTHTHTLEDLRTSTPLAYTLLLSSKSRLGWRLQGLGRHLGCGSIELHPYTLQQGRCVLWSLAVCFKARILQLKWSPFTIQHSKRRKRSLWTFL